IKLDPAISTLERRPPHKELLGPLLQELEFKSFYAKLVGEPGASPAPAAETRPNTKTADLVEKKTKPGAKRIYSKSLVKNIGELKFEAQDTLWVDVNAESICV